MHLFIGIFVACVVSEWRQRPIRGFITSCLHQQQGMLFYNIVYLTVHTLTTDS